MFPYEWLDSYKKFSHVGPVSYEDFYSSLKPTIKKDEYEIMRTKPDAFHHIPDHFKTQKICIKAVRVDPFFLELIPDHFKTQEICDKVVKEDFSSLQFVPDWFVTREWMWMWYDDYCYYDDDHWDDDDDEDIFFEWYNGYKKCKAQKSSIKEEFLPIAWHLSGWWD